MNNRVLTCLVVCVLFVTSCVDLLYIERESPNHDQRKNYFSKYDPGNIKYKGHYKVGQEYKINGRYYKPSDYRSFRQVGEASWYGRHNHGKSTANGDIFNKYMLTAAHKTLPLPSLIEVENLHNSRKLILLVNDRGPFIKGRVLDVSEYAAQFLGFKHTGLATVKIKYLPEATKNFLQEIGLDKSTGSRVPKYFRMDPRHSINAKIILYNLTLLNNLNDLKRYYFLID